MRLTKRTLAFGAGISIGLAGAWGTGLAAENPAHQRHEARHGPVCDVARQGIVQARQPPLGEGAGLHALACVAARKAAKPSSALVQPTSWLSRIASLSNAV